MRHKDRTVATIRATCPICGDVEMTPAQLQVLVCSADQRASYAFRCASCRLMVTKATDDRVVDVLVSSGVRLVSWDMPLEVYETHRGDPINWDDILAFHLLLSEEGGAARVLAEVNGTARPDPD